MLYDGLYEQVINKELDCELSKSDKLSQTASIDSAEAAKVLSKYVAEVIEKSLENVCNSVMRKLHHAGYVLEERNRTIINLDSYEVTAMIWAMNEYIHSGRFAEWVRTGGTK